MSLQHTDILTREKVKALTHLGEISDLTGKKKINFKRTPKFSTNQTWSKVISNICTELQNEEVCTH